MALAVRSSAVNIVGTQVWLDHTTQRKKKKSNDDTEKSFFSVYFNEVIMQLGIVSNFRTSKLTTNKVLPFSYHCVVNHQLV